MILKEGDCTDKLIEVLEELESVTGIDSLVKPGEKITLECVRERGKLKNWKVCINTNALCTEKPIRTGKNYSSFFNELKKLDQSETLFSQPDCYVMCYASTETTKDWKGNIDSNWILINPWDPYQIFDGVPVFRTKKLSLSESEYQAMTETGLVFWCETTDVFYPITEIAYSSIGRLLDCTMAFQRVDQHLLGSALLIAEKLTYRKALQIVYRQRSERVKPMVSMVGQKYHTLPQSEFFQKCLYGISTQCGVYDVAKWSVSDKNTVLDLRYPRPWNPFDFIVRIEGSDLLGKPYNLTAYADIDNLWIPLKVNRITHSADFSDDSIPALYEGVMDAFDEFEEKFLKMDSNCFYEFTSKDLIEIRSAIGIRRCKELNNIPDGIYHPLELFNEVCSCMKKLQLPIKQENDMRRALRGFFYHISDKILMEEKVAIGGQ